MFEQSGTFKNELKKLGQVAYDYDILNDFGETNFVIDLYDEINKEYERERENIFAHIKQGDVILAFFPCIRFEDQIILSFKGKAIQQRNWSKIKKLELDIKLMDELRENYNVLTKLAIICIRKGIKLMIENPYSEQHFLKRYWAIEPKIIDYDRHANGDYYTKPTQYFFIGFEPYNNLIFDEPIARYEKKKISTTHNKVERSVISKDYARRFIRQYLLPPKEMNYD